MSAGPTISLNLSRRAVFIWAVVILFFNQLFPFIRQIHTVSGEVWASELCAVSIFQYMAWYAIFRLLGASGPAPAGWRDVLVAIALCLLVFAPTSRAVWIAASGIAVYLWIFNRGDRELRAAGTILAALSIQEFWGHIFFDLFGLPILHAETAVVGTMLAAVRAGTVWHGNIITGPNGFGIAIYTGCSSFQNLSLAMLCWLTISKLQNRNWRFRDIMSGVGVGVTIILLNIIRLLAMAWNTGLYHYWHDGRGAEIFAIGASLAILLISLYGARSAGRPA